jgi:hypothetical protein
MVWVAVGTAVVGAATAVYSNNQANKRANQQVAAGQQASADQAAQAERMRFTPYAVTNSFGRSQYTTEREAQGNLDKLQELQNQGINVQNSTGVGPNGETGFTHEGQFYATAPQAGFKLNANVQQAIRGNQEAGSLAFQQAQERASQSPEALAKDRYARYLDFARPQQQSDFDKLLGGLATNGQLGYKNTATGTNPIIESFSRGLANSDRQQFNQAINDEQAITEQLFTRGRQGFTTANGLDGLGSQALSLGAELGGRSSQAGAAASAQLNEASKTGLAAASLQRQAGDANQANNIALGRTLFNAIPAGTIPNALNGAFSGGSNGIFNEFRTPDGVSGTGGYL